VPFPDGALHVDTFYMQRRSERAFVLIAGMVKSGSMPSSAGRLACGRSQKTNGWRGGPTFQAMTFNGNVDSWTPAFVADDRFWNTTSTFFAALPHGGFEPKLMLPFLSTARHPRRVGSWLVGCLVQWHRSCSVELKWRVVENADHLFG